MNKAMIVRTYSLLNLQEKSNNSNWKIKSSKAQPIIGRKMRWGLTNLNCSKSRIQCFNLRSKSTNKSRWKNKFVRLLKCKWWLKWNRHWAKALKLKQTLKTHYKLWWAQIRLKIRFKTWIRSLIRRTSKTWQKRNKKMVIKWPKCRFWIGCPLTDTLILIGWFIALNPIISGTLTSP